MNKKIIIGSVIVVAAAGGYFAWDYHKNAIYHDKNLSYGNGRLEATEIYISSKLSGKIEDIRVTDGDYVKKGQVLSMMQTNTLKAELAQAEAKLLQAKANKISSEATVQFKKSELEAMKAQQSQAISKLNSAKKRYDRFKPLRDSKAISEQDFENAETTYLTAKAELEGAKADIKKAQADISVAEAQVKAADANIKAATADVARIKADLDDCKLTAPLDGRVQYRISQPGEVLSAGGRVLNMIDLEDVYMTFYLPEIEAGKVKPGSEVRLVLDAIPDTPLPATVSYVANVAQFTPKTVETKVERQKLMFRVKAKIAPELLRQYREHVKTGLPGMAWVKLDPKAEWPEQLKLRKDRAKK